MKKIIVANWKCNPSSLSKARRLFSSFKDEIKSKEVIICPPFPYLPLLEIEKKGAQNCFYQEGAYTGEVSIKILKDLGCKYIIIGHSERRNYFKEDDDIIMKKIKYAIKNNITPILCIGEKEEEIKRRKAVLKRQMKGISSKVIIAYEPVWAIGSSNPCDYKEAKDILSFISGITESKILYGGSVNYSNYKGYLELGFDGLLLGGASLKKEEFIKIIRGI